MGRTHADGQEHEESCADMMKRRAPVLGTSTAGLQDIHPAEMTAAITEGVCPGDGRGLMRYRVSPLP